MSKGRMLIYAGRVAEGLALLDEAMVGLAAEEVSPVFAGLVYCALIEACQELSDFARAAAWTRALATGVTVSRASFPSPVSAPCTEDKCCGCAGPTTMPWPSSRGLNAGTPPSGPRRWPLGSPSSSGERYSGSVATSMPPQAAYDPGGCTRTGSATRLEPVVAGPGRTEPALAAVRRMLAETQIPWPGQVCFPPPSRFSSAPGSGTRLARLSRSWPRSPRSSTHCSSGDGGLRRRHLSAAARASPRTLSGRPRRLPAVARPRLSVRGCSGPDGAGSGPPRAGRRGVRRPRNSSPRRTVFAELGAEARGETRPTASSGARRRAGSPSARSRCSARRRGPQQRRHRAARST